jgi:hypothetical protein
VAESLEAELRRGSYPEEALPALDGTSRAVDALLELVE